MIDIHKPLVLVDGSSYLFRAFYALPPLNNSQGMPTGAIYGVLNMLRKLMNDYDPDYVAVIFDPKGKTFRNALYSEYKANRTVMPDDLRVQIQPLHQAIKALGFPLIVVDGVEADDVIGTLALRAESEGFSTVISTGDKDITQLVNGKITLINTMTNKVMDVDGVVEKFGVRPDQIIDYLTLVGDSVDNIPGVPNVGPKTAAKWLNQYDSLDNLLKHRDEIRGKVGENLRNHLSEIPLARQLVTIKTDVPVDFSISDLKPMHPDKEALVPLFQELGFKTWLQELSSEPMEELQQNTADYRVIFDEAKLKEWLQQVNAVDIFSFDTEATSLDAMSARWVGFSMAIKPNAAVYVPLAHDYLGAPQQLTQDQAVALLKPLLADKSKTMIGQNLKYDLKILKNHGLAVHNQKRDTLLESYILNSTSARHDMDTLAQQYLHYTTTTFEDIAGKGAKQLTFNQIPIETAGAYAAEDADITLRLDEKLYPLVKIESSIEKVFHAIEMPLMPILANMEYTGVLVDAEFLNRQSAEIKSRLDELQQKIHGLAGEKFNIDSPKQLQEILYNKLKLPVLKKTPTGQPSTAEEVLQELALNYPMPKQILEYRSLNKLKSTYTDKLPEQINPKTGRVHTHYNQAVTATGRLSSRDPNLQNIPVRTEQGRKIRQAFIAPKGYKVVAADYSQIELRIMAHLSQDPGLMNAFAHGLDVHKATAAEVFGVALDDVTGEQRRRAKAINFGLMYGMSAFGLSKQLDIPREDAQKYIDVYFHRYPKVHAYMEQARAKAATQGYVETLFGRRLYTPDINSKNVQVRMGAERQAINAPLQGSAADIIKLAMICVDDWLRNSNIDVKMIMQVHDELVFEIAESVLEDAVTHIRNCMENTTPLSVPLIVDVGVGNNWDEAH